MTRGGVRKGAGQPPIGRIRQTACIELLMTEADRAKIRAAMPNRRSGPSAKKRPKRKEPAIRDDVGRKSNKRRFYMGPTENQPQDCGRPHPQPICMCVLCEIAARFASIEDRERELARIKQLRDNLNVPWKSPRGVG